MSQFKMAQERQKDLVESKHFRSRFKHLQAHNGFRRGELHTFIAEKGGGKSTLVRAWIVDCLLDGKKVFLRLSEDKAQTYRDSIVVYLKENGAKYVDNLIIDSEIELSSKDLGQNYIESLNQKFIKTKCDIFILDNFTTSELSRTSPNVQEGYAVKLRQMAMDSNIPVVVVAHTEKGFNRKRGMATGDNIRGNMTLSNTAAYIYTLTIFHDLANKPTILFIDKARHHSAANKKLFSLNFENDTYVDDKPVTFDYLKLVLKDSQR